MTGIIQNFDRAVAGYEANSTAQAALAQALAQWIAPGERRGHAVEFGAGTGLFTRQMTLWRGTYHATDAAPQMVQRGKMLASKANWQIADARQPDGLGPADWIFACNLLQWLDEPASVLRSWRKILRPGGQMAVAVLLPGTFEELQTVLPETSPLRWCGAEEWRGLLERAGFSLERMESWKHVEIYPNALTLLRAVHAMGLAPQRKVGAGKLRAALRAYDKKFVGRGGVRATWQAWLARGRAV